MPLILTEPSADPIRTYRNYVKVIRLHEFLGPARASLSTEADSLSVCGTVIRDSQTITFSGTAPNETIVNNLQTSGLDTVRIHMNDLDISDNFHYDMYIGVRAEGEIDVTKQNSLHKFLEIGYNVSSVGAYVTTATFTSPSLVGLTSFAPKPETNPYYKIVNMNTSLFSGHFTEGKEVLVLRAATGVGGTFEWLLDTLYLVPSQANDFTTGNRYYDNHFRYLLNGFTFDPVYDIKTLSYDDSYDDSSLDWAGQYSVMRSAPPGYIGGDAAYADFQETLLEKTHPNIFGVFSPSNYIADPSSDLTMVFGSHYTPSHQIDEDMFDRTTTRHILPYIGESAIGNRCWRVLNNHPLQAAGATAGIWCDGTKLIFDDGKYDGAFPQYFPDPPSSVSGSQGDPIAIQLGGFSTESGNGSTTQGHETYTGMNHCIMECAVTTNHILVAGFHMFAGFGAANTSGDFFGVCLDIPSQDAFGARASAPIEYSLMHFPTYGTERELTSIVHQTIIDGPIELTSSFTANTWIRIKIEMMWYRYRAKVWLDGDTEPGSWGLDGFIPMPQEGSDDDPYLYPWTTHSQYGRRRRGDSFVYPTLGVRYFRPYEDINGNSMLFTSYPVRLTSTYWKELTLNYEAYGDTPTDVHLNLTKYDDTIDHGTVIVPYEAQRVIIAPTAGYTHNNDDDGFSISMWKESGAPDTQAAALGDIIQKQIIGGPIHLEGIRFRPYEQNEIED